MDTIGTASFSPSSAFTSRRLRGISGAAFVLWVLTIQLFAAGPGVERIGALAAAGTSDDVKKAVEDKGYRVTLDDGWSADCWFARALGTSGHGTAGALYPNLTNGQFVGVVTFAKGASDFRGQAIPTGTYSLRYEYIPQDANHMGVSPNPDFLVAIPIANDTDPNVFLVFLKVTGASKLATGTEHPAVFAMAPAGAPGSVAKDTEGMMVFTAEVATAAGKTEKLGVVVKGQATQ
jgi:hypothetical protein